ncbi:MAG: hypothetical protein WD928_00580 [Gammaproteobacteria bacterium]
MVERARETYRGSALIARMYRKVVRGKAWCQGREIASTEGDSEADVLTALRGLVDDAFTVETASGAVSYPSVDDYTAALNAHLSHLSERYRLMLRAHYRAPGRTVSAHDLAVAASYPRTSSATLHYAKIGRLLGETLLFQPCARAAGDPNWIRVLAEPLDDPDSEGDVLWRMRDELAEALEQAGLV